MLTPEHARIHQLKVTPSLPEPLEPLLEIAHNLWWTWHPEAVELFIRIGRDLWQECGHNPVKVLGACPQDRLEALARDDAYLAFLERVYDSMTTHLTRSCWFQRRFDTTPDCCIAYFCAEFAINECLQVYSGGLGVLAGDHVKSASELGLPFVGVGLMYRHGYFQQYLNADGWQQEYYDDLDFSNLPIKPVEAADGQQLTVDICLPDRNLKIAVWQATVGRVRLFLLDTNLPENDPADRVITAQLYGGDMDMRFRQELVLGIGGLRALWAMGIEPTVMHLNEGHAAFLALERIRRFIEQHNVNFDEARWACAAGNVFTTHTPVPAGIDRFPPDMIQRYFKDYYRGLKLDMEGLLALGRENVFNKDEFFSMAVLALRTSDGANAVSKLHGEVSRAMWNHIWPDAPAKEVPIGHVTNGIHSRTWLSPQLIDIFDRYLPLNWQNEPEDQSVWEGIKHVPNEELWRAHELRRQRLVAWVRRRLQRQIERRGGSTTEIKQANEALNHRTLTIGFARRFATYKRGNLLFRDPQRLMKLLSDPQRPVQIVIAGKAHPADTQGKELIKQIVHFAREHGAAGKVVFIENYDMAVARYLVSGVDVWLNNPRRGMEASGTSGMKAAANGVLNCSILDGWWDEAYHKDVGWAIGSGETYANYEYQDQVESQALYDLLEKQIIPMFYDRGPDGLPLTWIKWMKNCIGQLAPEFNTNRMVQQYTEQYYMPAHQRLTSLVADDLTKARRLAQIKYRHREHWRSLKIESVEADTSRPLAVREPLDVAVVARLDALTPDEVKVQLYGGSLNADGAIADGTPFNMKHAEDLGDGRHRFTGQITPENSGRYGFAVRILPGHPLLATSLEPGQITWDTPPKPQKQAKVAVSA